MNCAVVALLALVAAATQVRAKIVFGYEDNNPNNLVKNWNFEQAISSNDWYMVRATGTKVSGGFTGGSSLKVTNRGAKNDGAHQKITGISSGKNYYVSIHVKLLNRPPNAYAKVVIYARTTTNGGAGKNYPLGQLPYTTTVNKWMQVGGDFKTPGGGIRNVEIWTQVDPPNINYQLDTASMIELKRPADWKAKLNSEINKHRKNQLTISGSLSGGIDPSRTVVEVDLVRHEFGFGSAIKADPFNKYPGTNQNKYRNFMLKNCNWAVFENDMKWKPMEPSKGSIRYSRVDQAIDVLRQNDVTLRGHAIVWAVRDTNPNWIVSKTGASLKAEAERRIKYLMEHYKGKVFEYDVVNEWLHKHFFEDGLRDASDNVIEWMFRTAHKYDGSAQLCLNDYQLFRGGGPLVSAQVNIAKRLLAKGVPCHCIGAQSHMKTLPQDPEAVMKRVEILATAKLPISVTEYSAHSYNQDVRAAGVDTTFRVFFANPAVRSIVVWGFTDQYGAFANDHFLTQGGNFTPTKAGNVWLNLINKEWHTTKTIRPTSRTVRSTISAFRGKYKLQVRTNGVVKLEKFFHVRKGNNAVNFSV